MGNTGHTLDAFVLVYIGRFLLLPFDGIGRAFLKACPTLLTQVLIHFKS